MKLLMKRVLKCRAHGKNSSLIYVEYIKYFKKFTTSKFDQIFYSN